MVNSEVRVISRVQDEIQGQERGVRSWSMVEVTGDSWFQVETCSDVQSIKSITSYILPDVHRSLNLLKSLRGNSWSVLRLYARTPLLTPHGFVLETIRQVFATREGGHIFFLNSGQLLCSPVQGLKGKLSLIDAKEIYNDK